jgi:dUTP pyrophosphatase
MIKVEIINKSKNELPKYETPQSAGVDLRADLEEEITLQPLERQLIGTGLYIALQSGFEAQIRPRSGMAYKHGLTVLNSPGTIDADYRGEIKILMVNISNEAYTVKPAERIAQMVIAQHEQAEWEQF